VYRELCAWDNLLLAYRRASKGKRGQPNVAAFEHRLEDHLLDVQAELRSHAYRPGPYHSFYIHEPKRRLISAAPFRDRKVRAMIAAYRAGQVPLASVTASVQGWVNHVRYGNTVGLRKTVLGRLSREL